MSTKTRQVKAGNVLIGGGAPVSVQSMTNTDTADVEATLSQIRALTVAGAGYRSRIRLQRGMRRSGARAGGREPRSAGRRHSF